jgi:hypothetical protein
VALNFRWSTFRGVRSVGFKSLGTLPIHSAIEVPEALPAKEVAAISSRS